MISNSTGMNEEAQKIAIHAIFQNFIDNNDIFRTNKLDEDADSLYHKICEYFDIGGPILDDVLGNIDEVLVNEKKISGVEKSTVTGADFLMELCYQYFFRNL